MNISQHNRNNRWFVRDEGEQLYLLPHPVSGLLMILLPFHLCSTIAVVISGFFTNRAYQDQTLALDKAVTDMTLSYVPSPVAHSDMEFLEFGAARLPAGLHKVHSC